MITTLSDILDTAAIRIVGVWEHNGTAIRDRAAAVKSQRRALERHAEVVRGWLAAGAEPWRCVGPLAGRITDPTSPTSPPLPARPEGYEAATFTRAEAHDIVKRNIETGCRQRDARRALLAELTEARRARAEAIDRKSVV